MINRFKVQILFSLFFSDCRFALYSFMVLVMFDGRQVVISSTRKIHLCFVLKCSLVYETICSFFPVKFGESEVLSVHSS